MAAATYPAGIGKSGSARGRRGTVTVEYALVLSAVIGVMLISATLLGGRIKHVMQSASEFREVADAVNAPAAIPASPQVAAPSSTAPISAVSAWIVLCQTCAMLAIISWVLLERRKRLRQLDEENAVAEPIFTVDKGRHVFAKRQQIFKILSGNMEALLGSQLQVRHLMSDRVATVELRLRADSVREMMQEKHVRHLLVVDRQGKLAGIISDRDLRNELATTAQELMTANPLSVEADSLVNPAITQMMKRRISALPVVCEGKVQGVLTSTDLMMALQCCLQVLQSVADQIQIPPASTISESPEGESIPLVFDGASVAEPQSV